MTDQSVPASGLRVELAARVAEIGLDLGSEQIDQLLRYADLLARWGKVFNLSGPRAADSAITHHLLDCLAAVPAMDRWAQGRHLRVLDVGSGAGLPGVVVAMSRPAWQIWTIDAVAKKAAFVRQVAGEVRLENLTALHDRVEHFLASGERFDLIVSRAFASLGDFVRLTERGLGPGGAWLAMKGRPPIDEIRSLPISCDVFHVEQVQVPGLSAERCLVWIRPH